MCGSPYHPHQIANHLPASCNSEKNCFACAALIRRDKARRALDSLYILSEITRFNPKAKRHLITHFEALCFPPLHRNELSLQRFSLVSEEPLSAGPDHAEWRHASPRQTNAILQHPAVAD